MNHSGLKQCGRAFSVPGHLFGKGLVNIMKCFPEPVIIGIFLCDFGIARKTVCQHHQRIVGGGVAVHGNHIEGIRHVLPQRLLQKLFGNCKISRDKPEHGAHIRMDHAGALAHTANGHGLSPNLNLHRSLLRYCIRSHHGLHRSLSGFQRVSLFPHQHFHTGRNLFQRKLPADHAGGRHQHGVFRNAQLLRRFLCRLSTALVALFPRAGVCNAGVNNDSLRTGGVGNDFPVPQNGRRFHHITGKHSGCAAGHPTVN